MNQSFGEFVYLSSRIGSLSSISTSPVELCGTTLPRPLRVQSLRVAVFVSTTNNGSNYWTLQLRGVATAVALLTINTSAIAAGAWALLVGANAAKNVSDTETGVAIVAIKTGSPGALAIMPAVVYGE